MLDQIYSRRRDRTLPADRAYSPEQAILSSRLRNEGSSELAVVFPPWHGGGSYLERLVDRLANNGSAVLDFDFHDQILEPEVERVLESYRYIQEVATGRIEELIATKGYEGVRLLGMSMGTAALAMVASKLSSFTEATTVASSSSLARSVWASIKTKGLKEEFMKQGVSEESLDEAWQELGPQAHAPAFAKKKVQMLVATRDTVVPTAHQKELVEKFRDAGADTHPKHFRLGHYATLGAFYFFGR